MKKVVSLYILIFSLICINCSDDDSNTTDVSINPPEFIYGTWISQDSWFGGGFKFTSDDFCSLSTNPMNDNIAEDCFKEDIEMGFIKEVEEEATSSGYKINLMNVNDNGIPTYRYRFDKKSETEIIVKRIDDGRSVNYLLIKQ